MLFSASEEEEEKKKDLFFLDAGSDKTGQYTKDDRTSMPFDSTPVLHSETYWLNHFRAGNSFFFFFFNCVNFVFSTLRVSLCHHYSILRTGNILCYLKKDYEYNYSTRITRHTRVQTFVVSLAIHIKITGWNANSSEIHPAGGGDVFPPKALHYSRDSGFWWTAWRHPPLPDPQCINLTWYTQPISQPFL